MSWLRWFSFLYARLQGDVPDLPCRPAVIFFAVIFSLSGDRGFLRAALHRPVQVAEIKSADEHTDSHFDYVFVCFPKITRKNRRCSNEKSCDFPVKIRQKNQNNFLKLRKYKNSPYICTPIQERCSSGLRGTPGKRVYDKIVSRVRIPISPQRKNGCIPSECGFFCTSGFKLACKAEGAEKP